MVVIRPITLDDLPALEALTHLTGFGLTTLPSDEKLLRRRIRESIQGFQKLGDEDPPRGETYLFVMQDLETGKIAGTGGIVSKVGGFEPFYAYRMETSIHESRELGIRKEIGTLHLVEEHDGPCEVGSLFLSPDYRKDGNGRMLSLARFLFMADHKGYFDPMVIAEMRGVVDDHGRSPFWDALGRHFFEIDFPKADYLSMVNKKFIADLMPKHPIYIPLLPRDAQEVIGRVHPQTEPALRILQTEGFSTCDMVDIFEAGPVVRCPLKAIRTIRRSTLARVVEVAERVMSSQNYIIANTRIGFRACQGTLEIIEQGVRLPASVAAALHVQVGESVRFVNPRPEPHDEASHDAPSSI